MSMYQEFLAVKAKLSALPPVATGFYFVDRYAIHSRFMDVLREMKPSNDLYTPVVAFPLSGIPVYVLRGNENDDKLPAFCREPGVWVTLSDGTHKKIME